MDVTCLDHLLTDSETRQFDERGFFVLDQVLDPEFVAALTDRVDTIDARFRPERGAGVHDRFSVRDFIGQDELFLELLDWPSTFAKVWGILGWNIQMYHSAVVITPPLAADGSGKQGWGWHQDSGRLNHELEGNPRPRISIKVGYFLTDTSRPGGANLYVVPGSHLSNELEKPADGSLPKGAEPVLAPPGSALVFDRRLWHSTSPNHSEQTRKLLLYGYSYRWLRPRDDVDVGHFMDRCSPIRRQLLGAAPTGGYGFTSPTDEDVPLKGWLEQHLGPQN
ncbi:MAG: hypothetical protein GKR89_00765 [Candidatus Latescibacteria bacterium]|nr:hypothetical protein [Candidatus Latescibacterota bacterium]